MRARAALGELGLRRAQRAGEVLHTVAGAADVIALMNSRAAPILVDYSAQHHLRAEGCEEELPRRHAEPLDQPLQSLPLHHAARERWRVIFWMYVGSSKFPILEGRWLHARFDGGWLCFGAKGARSAVAAVIVRRRPHLPAEHFDLAPNALSAARDPIRRRLPLELPRRLERGVDRLLNGAQRVMSRRRKRVATIDLLRLRTYYYHK